MQEEERRKKIEMRRKMQNLTEEDRKQRHEWLLNRPVNYDEGNTGFGLKFYARQPHASFDLRARNDRITNYIVSKFNLTQPRTKSIEKIGEDYTEQRNRRELQTQRDRLETR